MSASPASGQKRGFDSMTSTCKELVPKLANLDQMIATTKMNISNMNHFEFSYLRLWRQGKLTDEDEVRLQLVQKEQEELSNNLAYLEAKLMDLKQTMALDCQTVDQAPGISLFSPSRSISQ